MKEQQFFQKEIGEGGFKERQFRLFIDTIHVFKMVPLQPLEFFDGLHEKAY